MYKRRLVFLLSASVFCVLSCSYPRLYLHRMSWQSYIDNLMMPDHSGKVPVAAAAIWGFESGKESAWASSPGLANITVEEIKKLSAKDRSSFGQTGVYIGGTRCRLIRDQLDMDGTSSLDLKTAADEEGNTYGICVGKTNKTFVIAKGTKDASGGQVSSMVFKTTDYLRKSGY